MPKPKLPPGEARDMLFRVRVNALEHATIEFNAKRAGMNASEYLRSQGMVYNPAIPTQGKAEENVPEGIVRIAERKE